MLSLSLVTLGLATTGLYAKPAESATGGLEVSLSTSTDKVASVSDLRVVATVRNTGREDAKVLKFGTVLDNELPTRSFIINKDGKEAPFTGIKASISMNHLSESDWVVIPAGENVTAEHDVSALYDFSASGPGTFTFNPISSFQVTGRNSTFKAISGTARTNIANAGSGSVFITITHDVSKRELNLRKRARLNCSDPEKASFISDSVREGVFMAMNASMYIRTRGADDPLYKAYFGSNLAPRVISTLENAGGENSTSRIMGCSDPIGACDGKLAAYTVISSTDIYYCDLFWDERPPDSLCNGNAANVVNALNLRGGTTLHELTHAVANTEDLAYECPDVRKLSDSDKLRNAANYECFAAQVYRDTMCCG